MNFVLRKINFKNQLWNSLEVCNFPYKCKFRFLSCLQNSSTIIPLKNLNLVDVQVKRYLNNDAGPPYKKLTPMSDLPYITWPSFIKSIRNFLFATLVIRPYFDSEFKLSEFVRGSKQAVEVISSNLAEGDFKNLDGLITNDLLLTLHKSVSSMSLAQREELSIKSEDIYFSFPYEVGVIFADEEINSKRYVEITMVYHTLRGLSLMRERGEEPPLNMGMLPEYRSKISICNYRFRREYSRGVQDDWTVNLLNHFKPADLVDQ